MVILLLFYLRLITCFNYIRSFWVSFTGKDEKKASVWKIVWRIKHDWLNARKENFLVLHQEYTTSDVILKHGQIPVDFDAKQGLATFLGIPSFAMERIYNTKLHPFFFNGVFKESQTLTTMSIHELLAVAESIPFPKDISMTFLWNVARCASTLLGSMFSDIKGWYSILEADEILKTFQLREKFGDEVVTRMTRSLIKLHLMQVKLTFPDCQMVVFKTRWMYFTSIFDVLQVSDGPKFHHFFMYRNVLSCIRSHQKAFGDLLLDCKRDSMISKLLGLKKEVDMIQGPLIAKSLEIATELDLIKEGSGWRQKLWSWNEMRNQSDPSIMTYFLWDRLPLLHFFYRMLVELKQPKDIFAVKFEHLMENPIPLFLQIVAKITGKDVAKDELITFKELEAIKATIREDAQANSTVSHCKMVKKEKLPTIITPENKVKLMRVMECLGQESDLELEFVLPKTLMTANFLKASNMINGSCTF